MVLILTCKNTKFLKCGLSRYCYLHSSFRNLHFFHWLYSPLGPWPLLFQFHDHFTDGRTPWASDQFVSRPLHKRRKTQTQNIHIHQISMPCVGFEPTIPAYERAKVVHISDRSATVIGYKDIICYNFPK
jgi:hypothetical protein